MKDIFLGVLRLGLAFIRRPGASKVATLCMAWIPGGLKKKCNGSEGQRVRRRAESRMT